ncbi:endogenous retrovirus group 3 member 1 Env polyprotein-like [Chiloscyllium punctatum]|uniref:endogenous retrovirus group 3 member 1 Env polyprotein-like n=1 Tax=Chiloscyllium punctatum TaxID=137246 RepID=UPI003B63F1F7
MRARGQAVGGQTEKTAIMNSTWTVLVGILINLLLYVGESEGRCDKCRTTVRLGIRIYSGSFVSHSYVDDRCYDVSARHECWEDGRPYYQVYNKGYGGKIRGCPINDRWVSISKTGRWDLSSVLLREQVDRIKETKIQITDRGLGKEQDRQGTVVLSKVPSVYEEVEGKIELPDVTQNLFIDLTSRIATVLNVSNCWVCGGPHMSEQWPWTGQSLDIWELLQTTWTHVNDRKSQGWRLTNSPEGQFCIEGKGTVEVGISPCQNILDATTRVWWPEDITWYIANRGHKNCVPLRTDSSSDELGSDSSDGMMRVWSGGCRGNRCWDTPVQTLGQESEYWNCSGPGPYEGVPGVKELWDDVVRQGGPAPDGLFWICGNRAYSKLPMGWAGVCFLGLIRPAFFLLPRKEGNDLGIKLFDSLRRSPRDIQVGDWGDEWPPARIIEYYGPATWAQVGSWGYRPPIYMLNRIIRLQAVVGVITNRTALALELLAKQQDQMRAAIYQNRLALDYLLASEGGVYGKFNLTNCCLEIDDNGKAVLEISDEIRKLAHVPVQSWRPLSGIGWWDGLLGGSWWRTALLVVGGGMILLLVLPCLTPCIQFLIQKNISRLQAVVVPQHGTRELKVMLLRKTKDFPGP